MKWFKENLIYTTVHGSQAYGLANQFSDVDIKGIVVPPKEVEYNLFHRFEQTENNPVVEEANSHLKNPNNPKLESTIYSLRKFFMLASEVNPNMIELLYTDSKHHSVYHPMMEKLLENRDLFLSTKARWTFAGYAVSQAKKIERHRKWIVMGELKEPTREEFGLPSIPPKGVDELHGYIKSKVEQWNLNQYPLEEMERANLKDNIWELLTTMTNKEVGLANWPDKYAEGVIFKMKEDFNLKDEVVGYIMAEREFLRAKRTYDSWVSWKNERNPARRELEVKSGYDTKHASHLVRLLRMGYEILSTGKVNVNREGIDAEELLSIKNGGWTYDMVIEYSKEMEQKMDATYKNYSGPLPQSVNKEKLNDLYHQLYEEYWDSKQYE